MKKVFWIVILLLLWEAGVRLTRVSPLILPSVSDVCSALWRGLTEGSLISQTLFSLALIASVRSSLSPHSEMTQKLARLESVIRRIFDFIEEHPERVMEMRRFMGYYLPTTKKLITQYQKLCDEQIQGENVAKAKGDIEGAIDTISLAFERMLDTFSQETAIDVASDISVMKAMFEQDGLTDDQLKPEAKTASQK